MSVDTSSQATIDFVVTGFGPFHDAPENPTTLLADKLCAYLSDKSTSYQRLVNVPVKTIVMETSAAAVQKEINKLYQQTIQEKKAHKEGTVTVLLHLGVNYRGKNFQVESCAYNDATFRVPDEQGYQPHNQTIVSKHELGKPLGTLLDATKIVQQVNATNTGQDKKVETQAVVSLDPGRFVCNYVYCYSLDKFACNKESSSQSPFRCIFLHVPPAEVVGIDEQLDFVARLMDAICKQIDATMPVG